MGSRPSARARSRLVGIDHRAGDLLHAVDAVGVGGERVMRCVAAERDGQRQQEFHIAAAPALAPAR